MLDDLKYHHVYNVSFYSSLNQNRILCYFCTSIDNYIPLLLFFFKIENTATDNPILIGILLFLVYWTNISGVTK